jgi:hypothetical protein
VRLREIEPAVRLEELIADAVGLSHNRRELRRPEMEADQPRSFHSASEFNYRILTSNQPTIDVIANVVNESRALILLDGLDEVVPFLRSITEKTMVLLARKCQGARLIVSCRSGDYNRTLEGFDPVEICSLDPAQVDEIIDRWSSHPREMRSALKRLPFGDLATRPLFLCELILLYEKRGFIPSQPAAIYRRVVLLALEEWDLQKPLHRRSRYSDFDPDRKLDFLANLAFQLTYILKTTTVTAAHLQLVYDNIRDNFDLPSGDSRQVIRELETHTGIFVEAGWGEWEFSHLSLQEFLAAHYLVRDQITRESSEYMLTNPAPVAVSVAIAASPSRRLAGIILSGWDGISFAKYNVPSFFSRLLQERPAFKVDPLLGFAALALIFTGRDDSEYVQQFLKGDAVRMSMASALRAYAVKRGASRYTLRLREAAQSASDLVPPIRVVVGSTKLDQLLDDLDLGLCESDLSFAGDFGEFFTVGEPST